MSRLADAGAPVPTREDRVEPEAQRRAVAFGLLGVLISVMLVIGAIASIVVAFGQGRTSSGARQNSSAGIGTMLAMTLLSRAIDAGFGRWASKPATLEFRMSIARP